MLLMVAAIAVVAVQCQFRGTTTIPIFAAAEAQCEIQPDGTEVCTIGEINPSAAKATASDDDVPPPSSSSINMNDPEWRERARRNNVVTDPDEIRRIHARYEADRAAGRAGEMRSGGDWGDAAAHDQESESPKAYADGDAGGTVSADSGSESEAASTPDEREEEEPPEMVRYEDGGLLVTSKHECVDLDDDCLYQISTSSDPGECMDPPEISRLARRCRKSCKLCKPDNTEGAGEVRRTTIGVAQRNDGIESEREAVSEVLTEMVRYLREEVLVEPGYENCYRDCVNRHELCAFWASVGECTNNPTYMDEHCSLACKRCNLHPEYLHRMIL